jgi:hypothetical protein
LSLFFLHQQMEGETELQGMEDGLPVTPSLPPNLSLSRQVVEEVKQERWNEKGSFVHTNIQPPPIHLQMGHKRLRTYIMAFFNTSAKL